MTKHFEYDVALSFAGEDREYVDSTANILKYMGINVFYDRFEEENLWGKNLYEYLSDIYYKKAHFTIMFISEHYAKKLWTGHERQAMQARAFEENREYILPARFDDTQIPGMLSTIGYISLKDKKPKEFANMVVRKVQSTNAANNINEKLNIELQAAETKSMLEGLKSPTEWFINWRNEINAPTLPPRHWLLNSVFVERELYSEILYDFINGKKKAGITGFLGMGGVGKTYTALKISWELIEKHNWQVVWVGLLQQGTEEALDHIANSFGLYFANSLKLEEKIVAIRQLLSRAIRKFPKLLTVLDNAENFPRLDLLLEALRDIPVLVTSRKRECSDIVPYQKIEPLKGQSAIDYCRSLLTHYNFRLDESKNDINDLMRLSSALGGHPLGIRLALTGFIRKPTLEQLKNRRFMLLLDEIQKENVGVLSSDNAQSDTLDEKQLHKSIESTFLWTYDELIDKNGSISQKAAYVLLPIMSALGTTSVTKSIVYQGIEYLSKQLHDKSSDPKKLFEAGLLTDDELQQSLKEEEESTPLPENFASKTEEILNWFQTDNISFDAAVSQLVDLALVEILDADKQIFALHPLIREFSFHYIEKFDRLNSKENQKHVNYLYAITSDAIFRMAINIVGSEHGNETLLDLLPRLKQSRQLVEMAITHVKKQHDALYFRTDIAVWPYLEELLSEALDLASTVGLVEEEIWLGLELGELKSRSEKKDGPDLIDTSINKYIQVNEDKNHRLPSSNEIFDWSVDKWSSLSSKIIWSCLYNHYYKRGFNTTNEILQHIMQLNRLLLSKNSTTYTYKRTRLLSEFQEYISTNIYASKPSTLSCINQQLLSNIILDLQDWLNTSINFGHPKESLIKAQSLFDLASNNMNKINDSRYVISIEHSISFEKNFAIRSFEFGVHNRNSFEKNIDVIRHKAISHGIRGFDIEAEYCSALAKKHFEQNEWTKVGDLVDQAKHAIAEIQRDTLSFIIFKNKLSLLKICASVLLNSEDNLEHNVNELKVIEDEVYHNEYITVIPLLYLAKACIENSKSNESERNLYAAQSEKAYLQLLGYIPPYVRPLLSQWRNWSISYDQVKIDEFASWRINYSTLPEKVRSTIDNRTMILVHPGIQWTEAGNEHWLYPFYIDEHPVDFKTLAIYAKEKEFVLEKQLADDSVVSLSDVHCEDFLSWAGKKLPIRTEVFAASIQLEKKIFPEQWTNMQEMITGMYKRIELFIKNGKPSSRKETIDKNKNERSSSLNKVAVESEKNVFQLEKFYSDHTWLLENDDLKNRFEKYILNRFKHTELSSDEQFMLAIHLATSMSLSIEDKEKVLKKAEDLDEHGKSELTPEKCTQLLEVFLEERKKFLKLAEEQPNAIRKLYNKTKSELFFILKVIQVEEVITWDKWHLKVTDIAHTDLWKKQSNLNDYKCKDVLNNTEPVLRGIIPIFTQKDMMNLEPI